MNLRLIKLQVLVSGLLSLVLAGEWGYGQIAEHRLQESFKLNEDDDVAGEELPTIDTLDSSAETYSELVERPLFIQGRKPIVEANPADKAQAVETGQIDDWLLIGVFNKDHRQMALFAKKNEAKKYLKLGSEQTISGWQIKEIKSDRVVLLQGGQEKSVLLRKPRPENKMPMRPKPPVPPRPVAPAQPTNINPETPNDDSETN